MIRLEKWLAILPIFALVLSCNISPQHEKEGTGQAGVIAGAQISESEFLSAVTQTGEIWFMVFTDPAQLSAYPQNYASVELIIQFDSNTSARVKSVGIDANGTRDNSLPVEIYSWSLGSEAAGFVMKFTDATAMVQEKFIEITVRKAGNLVVGFDGKAEMGEIVNFNKRAGSI